MAKSKDTAAGRGAEKATKSAKAAAGNGSGANLGFEQKLWQAADKLRNNMDAAEYKHVVLGLIFLKYISDAFEEKHAELVAERDAGADPEDPDEYRALDLFWVPPEDGLHGRGRPPPTKARTGIQCLERVRKRLRPPSSGTRPRYSFHTWWMSCLYVYRSGHRPSMDSHRSSLVPGRTEGASPWEERVRFHGLAWWAVFAKHGGHLT